MAKVYGSTFVRRVQPFEPRPSTYYALSFTTELNSRVLDNKILGLYISQLESVRFYYIFSYNLL